MLRMCQKLFPVVALTAILVTPAEARSELVGTWLTTTLCKTYESAVIARQIRKGNLPGRAVPSDCEAAKAQQRSPILTRLGPVLHISIAYTDGTTDKYWVGSDDVGPVHTND